MYDPLTTIDRVKQWLEISADVVANDALLTGLIESCSDQIGRFCGRDNLGSVEAYVETRWPPASLPPSRQRFVLDHYPVVTMDAVKLGQSAVVVVTDPAANPIGAFVERDKRTLTLMGVHWPYGDAPLQVTYTAGFALADIPTGLDQACCQFVGEVFKSKSWIGYLSKTLATETVTFDRGAKLGMSPRTVAMLQPFMNRIPPQL